jgi:hypothetical protein
MREFENPTQRAIGRADNGRTTATRRVDHHCSSRQLCVRCSMMMVIQHRFKAFHRAFGRFPQLDEPLFFDPKRSTPLRADSDLVRAQLTQAAKAAGVALLPLLKFLGFE